MEDASLEEIQAAGIPKSVAENVLAYFNIKEKQT